MTFLMLDTEFKTVGPSVCALERGKILAGTAARMICKQLNLSGAIQLVPADLDGKLIPPASSPEFILGTTLKGTGEQLLLYRYKATWGATPTLVGTNPVNLGVAAFTHACIQNQPSFSCIPQKNGAPLAISFLVNNGIMNRVAYRHFPAVGGKPAYGVIVANHSITGPNGKPSAIRWYQFNVPSTFMPTKVQQGTYSPNAASFFNGSIAMDKVGNIALGYNVSSATMFPSIAITGRAKGDAANTLRAPMTVINGAGALVGSPPLWGTNSSLSLDPVDNCSFWYTTEYMLQNAGTKWSTRIAKFKLPGCQ